MGRGTGLGILLGMAVLPLIGCASADPLAGKGSTAHPALQKSVYQAQTEASAGLAVSPSPTGATQACSYDTAKGPLKITIAAADKCPLTPPSLKASTRPA